LPAQLNVLGCSFFLRPFCLQLIRLAAAHGSDIGEIAYGVVEDFDDWRARSLDGVEA